MKLTIFPGPLSGSAEIPASKSWLHRAILCAALAENDTSIAFCGAICGDVQATLRAAGALGARVQRDHGKLQIHPGPVPSQFSLDCGQSAATLRLTLPLAAALGLDATFLMDSQLAVRPLTPLLTALNSGGCRCSWDSPRMLHCRGRLRPGSYTLPGDISSQFLSGMLIALPLTGAASVLEVQGTPVSRPYLDGTLSALRNFGISIREEPGRFLLSPGTFFSPGAISAEGDWSAAAFFLAGAAVNGSVQCGPLSMDSWQGDRQILPLLAQYGASVTSTPLLAVSAGVRRPMDIFCGSIPDLVPILAVLGALTPDGETVLRGVGRLRGKESDRLTAIVELIHRLGGRANADGDCLAVRGGGLLGGEIRTFGDHRIAMAAAVAAVGCQAPVIVPEAECVGKSFPEFWHQWLNCGGKWRELS